MTVNLSALAGAGQQFFDNNGVILSGGKLYSYAAGSSTPQAAYTSSSGSTAHTNPIILNSAGRVATGEIWLTSGVNYKFVLYTSADVLIASWDNISGINGTGIATNALYVAYDPAGAGAVSTNVQAKLRESVSVKDFGAVGDGGTDDTVAVQAAINFLSSGGTVYFPSGCTCAVISTINIPYNNITLFFADWTAGIKPLASMTTMISVTGDGVKFFNGNFSNQSSYATNAISRSGTVAFGMTVSGCYIASFTNGISWSAAGNAGLTAQNNYFNSILNAAINFTEDGRNSVVTDSQFLGGKYGIYATHAIQQIEGLIIQNNLIQTSVAGDSCIYMNGSLYINISNNNLSGTACIVLAAGTTDHQIAYTIIKGNYLGAKAFGSCLVSTGNNAYMTISDNMFDGSTSTVGLNLTDVTFSRFTDNDFVNMTGTQISTTICTYNNFFGNQLRGSGTGFVEDATSQAVWVGNFGTGTKSPRSYFYWNWQDDVLTTESNWTSYAPTIASSTGTITSYTATGAYRRLGTTTEVVVNISITNNGTGSGQIIVQLPITSKNSINQTLTGSQTTPSVFSVNGITSSNTNLFVTKYDGTYPGATGSAFNISGTYQAN